MSALIVRANIVTMFSVAEGQVWYEGKAIGPDSALLCAPSSTIYVDDPSRLDPSPIASRDTLYPRNYTAMELDC